MEELVLADLGERLYEPPEELEFGGTELPSDDVWELFMAYRNHGVLPLAGGYYDQPLQWRNDIRRCRMWYAHFYDLHKSDEES